MQILERLKPFNPLLFIRDEWFGHESLMPDMFDVYAKYRGGLKVIAYSDTVPAIVTLFEQSRIFRAEAKIPQTVQSLESANYRNKYGRLISALGDLNKALEELSSNQNVQNRTPEKDLIEGRRIYYESPDGKIAGPLSLWIDAMPHSGSAVDIGTRVSEYVKQFAVERAREIIGLIDRVEYETCSIISPA